MSIKSSDLDNTACELIKAGLREVIKDIEQALEQQFRNQLEKREDIVGINYGELIGRIRVCDTLIEQISNARVRLIYPVENIHANRMEDQRE